MAGKSSKTTVLAWLNKTSLIDMRRSTAFNFKGFLPQK
jgi:hypothetical protein